MANEPNLLIRLAPGTADKSPVLICPEGHDPASALAAPGLVVFHGERGWVVSDGRTDRMTFLSEETWSRLGGWELRLAEEPERANAQELDEEFGASIVDNHSGFPPWFMVHDHGRPGAAPTRVWLPARAGESVLVGRSSEVDIQLSDKSVCRRQARLTMTGDRIWMENLGRYPPTVNGKAVEGRVRLAHGDTVAMGKSTLVFHHPIELGRDPVRSRSKAGATPAPADAVEDRPFPAAAQMPTSHTVGTVDPVQWALVGAIVLVLAFIGVAVATLL